MTFKNYSDLCFKLTSNAHPVLGIFGDTALKIANETQENSLLDQNELTILRESIKHQYLGLIGTPRSLLFNFLNSPEVLTETESEHMRTHTRRTFNLLKNYDLDMATTIRYSHEFWDGSGYPGQKQRENIPKISRYLTILNYFSESPYNKADTFEKIENASGLLFHPESVRLFLQTTKSMELPEKVEELLFADLQPGMLLAHPLHTPTGVMLFPENQPIDQESHRKLVEYNDIEPIQDRILVYKSAPVPS